MLKVKLTESEFFKNIVASLQIIVEEAVFNLSPDEISFRAWDSSRVAVVNCVLPKSTFEEYTCDQPTKICLSLLEISKFLKGTKGKDPLEISVERNDFITLQVAGEYRKVFNLSTLAIKEEEEPSFPSLSFDAKLRITSPCFRRMVEDVATMSDHIRIKASENDLTFNGVGDLSNVELTLVKGSENLLNFEVGKVSSASYSANFLLQIAKEASSCSSVVG
jgi:proliferating cell nuclear antigen